MAIFVEPVHRLRARTQYIQQGNILLLQLGMRRARIEPFDNVMRDFLELIVAGGTSVQIRERFLASWDEKSWQKAERCLETLLDNGFIEQVNISHGLDPLDVARFDRLVHFFSEYETKELSRFDYLTRLRNARVGVIGIGGMGSWVVYNLLCCGIGHLCLIDGDRVEASNLNRSILYTEADIGDLKVDAAVRSIKRFAPRVSVETHDISVSGSEMLLPYLDNLDLVIGAADQPQWLIKEWIACACQQVGVPAIQASGLRVGPFYLPGKSSCAICYWEHILERNPHYREIVIAQRNLPRGKSGSRSPLGTITAGVLSLESFRYLSGYTRPMTINAVWEMSGNGTALLHPVLPHHTCKVCREGS